MNADRGKERKKRGEGGKGEKRGERENRDREKGVIESMRSQ